jgi:hypothetical protein
MYYFEGGAASGASLEYGLILLWAATYVGLLGTSVGAFSPWDRSKRPVLTYLGFAWVPAIAHYRCNSGLAGASVIAMIAAILLPR